jgi:hypothetical protein
MLLTQKLSVGKQLTRKKKEAERGKKEEGSRKQEEEERVDLGQLTVDPGQSSVFNPSASLRPITNPKSKID